MTGTVPEENGGSSGDSFGAVVGHGKVMMVAMSYRAEGQRRFRTASPGAARVLSRQ
jgi:hypothetical protein